VTAIDTEPVVIPTALYDARHLARGWLAVALASVDNLVIPSLDRTVAVEHFRDGVRLVATDGIVLLRTWVPNVDCDYEREPTLDELPDATAVVIDSHGRAKSLFGHLFDLIKAADKAAEKGGPPPEPIEVRLTLGVTEVEPDEQSLDLGDDFEPSFAVIEHPGRERLKLRCYGGDYPDWRKVVARFARQETDGVALSPEVIGRLAKLGKLYPARPLLWYFGGADRMAIVEVGNSYPWLRGAVMPVRWDFDADRPMGTGKDGGDDS
jgi:hypothetical protein